MYSANYGVLLVMNIISTNMIGWAACTSYDFNENLSYLVPFIRNQGAHFTALTAIEAAILRYLTEFVWKRVPPIDQDFTARCLIGINLMLSIITGTVAIMSGNSK